MHPKGLARVQSRKRGPLLTSLGITHKYLIRENVSCFREEVNLEKQRSTSFYRDPTQLRFLNLHLTRLQGPISVNAQLTPGLKHLSRRHQVWLSTGPPATSYIPLFTKVV